MKYEHIPIKTLYKCGVSLVKITRRPTPYLRTLANSDIKRV